MIITIKKGGRTRRDATKVMRHVLKAEDNDYVVVAEIGNTVGQGLAAVFEDALIARNGAVPGSPTLFHITINPEKLCSQAAFMRVAHLVRAELDPALTRAYAVVIHGKPRATGSGRLHGHLILANFADGRALKDRYSAMRVEKCARLAEHKILNERATLGRCHAAVVRALRLSAPDTAAWMVAAFGETPEKPRAGISSSGRQRAKRLGVNLPKARAVVQRLWADTGNLVAFERALMRKAYKLEAGKKAGVWIVRDTKSGLVIGALDRLIRERRSDIRTMMEAYFAERDRHADGRTRPQDLRENAQNRGGLRGVETSANASVPAVGTRRSDQPDVESLGEDRRYAASAARDATSATAHVRDASVPNGRDARGSNWTRVWQFRRGLDRTRMALIMARYEATGQERLADISYDDYPNRVDAWGIGQVRPPSP